MTHEAYYLVAGGCATAAIVLWLILARQLRELDGSLAAIGSDADLERFKAVVKVQMLTVLLLLPLALVPIAIWMWMMATHEARIWNHLAVVVYGGFFHLATAGVRRTEEKLRTLRVTAPWLKEEYEEVVRSWRQEMFPHW